MTVLPMDHRRAQEQSASVVETCMANSEKVELDFFFFFFNGEKNEIEMRRKGLKDVGRYSEREREKGKLYTIISDRPLYPST